MGRYYQGDIEGKFWFGIQSSTDANFFGEYKGKKTRNKNFMQKAWKQGHKGVLRNGLEEAEKIFKEKNEVQKG